MYIIPLTPSYGLVCARHVTTVELYPQPHKYILQNKPQVLSTLEKETKKGIPWFSSNFTGFQICQCASLAVPLHCAISNFSHIHSICHVSRWFYLLADLFVYDPIQFEIFLSPHNMSSIFKIDQYLLRAYSSLEFTTSREMLYPK